VLASLVWLGGLACARWLGLLTIEFGEQQPLESDRAADPPNADKREAGKRRKRGPARGGREGKRASGESISGDDLGGAEPRNLDVARGGGEEQLLDSEIEQAFDQSFPQVRRCLVLASGDEPVRGTLTFGMRISGREGVTRVNLNGPSAVTQSEAGDCLRKAVQAMRLRSFNGPDMVVHYPLTLH
jgi:hypothetical protein